MSWVGIAFVLFAGEYMGFLFLLFILAPNLVFDLGFRGIVILMGALALFTAPIIIGATVFLYTALQTDKALKRIEAIGRQEEE